MPILAGSRSALSILAICMASAKLSAQISLQVVLDSAIRNSPRVKMVQDDLTRATAVLSESKDVYIPTLGVGGGLGRSYGISFVVPSIVTITSQSLVYSSAQRSYIHAARDNLRAAQLAFQDVREQIEEDAVLTYITLDAARARESILMDEGLTATQLFNITQQRAIVGLDSDLDVKRSKRILLQLQIQLPQVKNDILALQEHISQLTGLAEPIVTIHGSIPPVPPASVAAASRQSLGVLSLQAVASARKESAKGDSRYTFHPQIMMQAQYGRISPINDVSEYYNLNGRYNSTVVGVSIQVPLFDKAHAARARETLMDALHAQHEAQYIESQQREDRLRFENSLSVFSARADLAKLDWEIAKDQWTAISLEVKSRSADVTGGRQMTPKDELNSHLEEAQRHLDWMDADLQLQRTQVTNSRLNGTIGSWLAPASGQVYQHEPLKESSAP